MARKKVPSKKQKRYWKTMKGDDYSGERKGHYKGQTYHSHRR